MSSRYFDRFGTTNKENYKDWNNLKFGPDTRGFGKRLQSAELNEIQSTFSHFDEKLARTLLREGEVVSGADISRTDSTTIVITEGLVFMDGRVRKINDALPKSITGVGKEYIKIRGIKNLIVDDAPLEPLDSYSYDGTKEVSTELSDPALATIPYYKSREEWESHNKYGAYRESYVYEWYIETTETGTISYTLLDGEKINEPLSVKFADFWQDVARRTYLESGNYVIETPLIRAEKNIDSDATNFNIVVESFKAYIKGYQAEIGVAQRVSIDKGIDTVGYSSSVDIIDDSSSIYLYQIPYDPDDLGNNYYRYVKDITIPKTTPTWPAKGVRTLTDATDTIVMDATNIQSLEFKDGVQLSCPTIVDSGGNVYKQGIHYKFITGNRPSDYDFMIGFDHADIVNYKEKIGKAIIYWITTRPNPSVGVSYTVEYQYWEHTIEGTYVSPDSYSHYSKITAQTDMTLLSTDFELRDYLDFRIDDSSPSVVSPRLVGGGAYDGIRLDVSGDRYLHRTDVVYIDQKAEIKVQRGNPSDEIIFGTRLSEDVLTVAAIQIQPYTYNIPDNINIETFYNRRYTMDDIHRLERRVDILEYFMTLDILEQRAYSTDIIGAKKGIFTDGFKGSKRCDLYYEDGTFTSTVSFDTKDDTIKLPFSVTQQNVTVDDSRTTLLRNDQIYTLPFEEKVFAEQFAASGSISIQPFQVFEWPGELTTVPAHDIFVETETIPTHLNADYSIGFGSGGGELDHMLEPFKRGHGSWQTLIGGYYSANTFGDILDPGPPLGLIQIMENKILDVTISPFIRESTITVFGDNLRPNAKNLKVTFDGVEIYANNTVPEASDEDTIPGRVETDENGSFQCTISIPSATFRTGEREIRIDNFETADADDKTFATCIYFAKGVVETRYDVFLSSVGYQTRSEESTTPSRSGKKEYVIVNQPDVENVISLDSVGQSFTTDDENSIFLSSIDVFFKAKASTVPVTLFIVTMKNGYPTRQIVAQKTLKPDDINISSDASVATNFSFPDPIALSPISELAFTLYAGDPTYELFASRLGDVDIITGDRITKNPYSGVLFTSPNQRTWQPDGFRDLKFRLNICDFVNTSTVSGVGAAENSLVETTDMGEYQLVFDNISGINAANIVINTTQTLPNNTDVKWFYSTNDGESWKRAIPAMDNFLQNTTTTVDLRADFTGEGASPTINIERTGLVFMLYEPEGEYIGRHLHLDANCTELKVILEQNSPSGTIITLFYKREDDDWVEMTGGTYELTDRDLEKFEVTYETTGLANFNDIRFAIRLETVNQAITPSVYNIRAICS